MTELTITVYKEKWTGKNKKELEKFFKKIKYPKIEFIEDNKEFLLYDAVSLIEKNTILYGCEEFGIIKKELEEVKNKLNKIGDSTPQKTW